MEQAPRWSLRVLLREIFSDYVDCYRYLDNGLLKMVFKTCEMDMSLNYLPSIDNSKILSFQDAKK